MGFVRNDRGFTGAERALMLCFGLAIVMLVGALVRRGSEKSADDARKVLMAGWGSASGGMQTPAISQPPGAIDNPGAPGTPGPGSSAGPLTGSDAFDQIVASAPPEEKLPEQITLPPELNSGMQRAWEASHPKGMPQEQGGLLVRRPDGSYVWRPSPPGQAGSIDSKDVYSVVQPGDTPGVMVHTHPHRDPNITGISFSGADMANIIYTPEGVLAVQSGDTQFALVRTAEFEAKLAGLDEAGKQALYNEMRAAWDEGYKNLPGDTIPERSENAAQYMARMYGLGYYRGRNGSLRRVDTSGGP
jgi:hypothetical protein